MIGCYSYSLIAGAPGPMTRLQLVESNRLQINQSIVLFMVCGLICGVIYTKSTNQSHNKIINKLLVSHRWDTTHKNDYN